MIPISIDFYQSVIDEFEIEINEIIKDRKDKLRKFKNDSSQNFTCFEKSYLELLFINLKDVILANPIKLDELKKSFKELPEENIRKKEEGESKKKNVISFKNRLINVLDYDELRSNFYPLFFQKVGVKSCVYCNSQLTVAIDSIDKDGKDKVKAKFQLDHYLSKSKYPCFAISFFNLYPVCASCNNVKSDDPIEFNLYSNDDHKLNNSSFNFSFKKGSVAKYLTDYKLESIEIEFSELGYNKGEGTFQKTFDIEGIYDSQKDIAEELIIKNQIYNQSYKNVLVSSFPGLFVNASLNNRLIIGNYGQPNELHKRPLAKFTQDLARELGLLPKL